VSHANTGPTVTARHDWLRRCRAVILRILQATAPAILLATAVACDRSTPAAPAIVLNGATPEAAVVEVTGLSKEVAAALDEPRTPEAWAAVLRVAVADDAPPVLGTYRVTGRTLRFTPAFPFDPGRQYLVRFDASPGGAAGGPVLAATVGLPATTTAPSTTVTAIHPSGDVLPENLLRMYVTFSAPMSAASGIGHVDLLGPDGVPVEEAFLPLDYEFWSPDHTRFTVFFDPGRVKRGILPNRQSGRALVRGRRYTLVVKTSWRDANGLPLREEFRKTFTAGPADMQPLDTATWRIEPPETGSRTPLSVRFPEALDHGLLARSLGVRFAGRALDGDGRVEDDETRWTFTPREPWSPGRYELLALSILEDHAGNQIGRAFEVDNFEAVDESPDPRTVTLAFAVGGAGQ
jgi:hypothetical protein